MDRESEGREKEGVKEREREKKKEGGKRAHPCERSCVRDQIINDIEYHTPQIVVWTCTQILL